MRAARVAAGIAAVCGAGLAVVPFLGWFRAATPAGEVRISGVDAAGGLWAMALLGLVIAAAGVAVASGRVPGGILPGAAIAVPAGAALVWCAVVTAAPRWSWSC